MWWIFLFSPHKNVQTVARTIMSNEQMENYTLILTPENQITWQISLSHLNQAEGFEFSARVTLYG